MKLRRVKEYGALKCPFCRDSIYPAPSVTRCLKCKTVYHEKCWEERGSCSVFGCKGTPQQELTDLFYIELFQGRRRKFFRSWIAAGVTSLIVFLILYHALEPLLPIPGRIGFSIVVVLFLTLVIFLAGYTQYFCPACGRQPTKQIEFDFHPLVGFWWNPQPIRGIRNKLILNPIQCPHCHVRLRA